jgi:hypothetical protein
MPSGPSMTSATPPAFCICSMQAHWTPVGFLPGALVSMVMNQPLAHTRQSSVLAP